MQEIESRVRSAKDQAHHPLLMMGIFAELERKRLVGLVDKLLDNFTLRAEHVENGVWNPATEMDSMKAQGNLRACFQSQNLVDHIRAVKRQLSKFLTEIDNVADIMFSECSAEQCSENIDFQMKQRIRDIMIEYDDKIDECNMVIGNTSLAMQTVRISDVRALSKNPWLICGRFGTISQGMTQRSTRKSHAPIRGSPPRLSVRVHR